MDRRQRSPCRVDGKVQGRAHPGGRFPVRLAYRRRTGLQVRWAGLDLYPDEESGSFGPVDSGPDACAEAVEVD